MEDQRKKREQLIDEECTELIEEVFLRLPPPSVARFKCLSKRWRRFLSEPQFLKRYQARNVSLLGFFNQRSPQTFVFRGIPSNFRPDISTGDVARTGNQIHCGTGNAFAVISSSNGLLLLYCSKPTPRYQVGNPITGDKVSVRFNYGYQSVGKRYMVFGFAFDPYSTIPCFTIVDIADDLDRKFRIFSYSSLSGCWETTFHKVPWHVKGDYALSGPSTFYRGALHWLIHPSGVVAYDVRAKTISFSLINIPGEKKFLDAYGVCRCVKEMRDGGFYSNGYCNCRYLGESRDQLIYIRVTGHSQFSLWTLKDYCRGIWCRTGRIVVSNLPASLFFGCLLAFDRMEPRLLYLRVKNKIFSYSRMNGELKEFCRIVKEYGGEQNCLGFIIPYELPRISPSIPCTSNSHPGIPSDDKFFAYAFYALKHLLGDPSAITEDFFSNPKGKKFLTTMAVIGRCLNNDGLFQLYSQFGISQVVANCFPNLQSVEFNATGPPVWSSYNFHAPFTFTGLRDTVVNYNDFIRVEASLYGFTAERFQQNL